MDRIVDGDGAGSIGGDTAEQRPEAALRSTPEGREHGTASEEQKSLDRQLDAWNAFHAEHGLLSDDLDLY